MNVFTVENGDKKIEISGISPDDLLELVEKHKKKIQKAKIGTTIYEYNNLKDITEVENGKKIAFNFAKNTLHLDMTKGRFINPDGTFLGPKAWNEVIRIHNLVNYAEKTDVPWIKCFLVLIQHCIFHNSRVSQRYAGLEAIDKHPDIVKNVESFAKIKWCQEVDDSNIHWLAELCHRGDKHYKDVKGDKEWFFVHKNERVDQKYLYRGYGQRNPQSTLAGWMRYYFTALKHEAEYIFKHAWETYNAPLAEMEVIKEIVEKYNCEYKAAVAYILITLPKQGMRYRPEHHNSSANQWRDYLKMSTDMGGKFEKYPKYLATMHDIAMTNYELKQDDILRNKYKKTYENIKGLEYKGEKYSIVIPATIADIVAEGNTLGHCVASYVDKAADGKTIIAFLRNNDDIKSSLVTLEISTEYKIIQKGGRSNKTPEKEELEFLNEYTIKHLYKMGAKKETKKVRQ